MPTLLQALRQPGKTATQALKVHSHSVCCDDLLNSKLLIVFAIGSILIPTLMAIPMTVLNARALASPVTVVGNALSRRLAAILNSLVKALEDDIDDELRGLSTKLCVRCFRLSVIQRSQQA